MIPEEAVETIAKTIEGGDMTEDIQKYEARHPETASAVQPDSNAVILAAMGKGYTPEQIEKMMDLAERNEKNEARKAYNVAMAAFKLNPPEIVKDKQVEYTTDKGGTVGYKHASLANVTTQINKSLSVHGLSAGWKTKQEDGSITVTCTITHSIGHSENTALSAAPDNSGKKNAIQAIGSTISYLERYTILALTGLATHDQDDDGAGGEPEAEFITPEQAKEITALIKEKNIDVKKWLDALQIDSVEAMRADWYSSATRDLKAAAVRRNPGEDDS